MSPVSLNSWLHLLAQTERQRASALALWAILATISLLFIGIVISLYMQRRRRHLMGLGIGGVRRKKRRFRPDPWKEAANRVEVEPAADADDEDDQDDDDPEGGRR